MALPLTHSVVSDADTQHNAEAPYLSQMISVGANETSSTRAMIPITFSPKWYLCILPVLDGTSEEPKDTKRNCVQ